MKIRPTLPRKKTRSIIEIKPEHFGCQYRNLSEEIDEIVLRRAKSQEIQTNVNKNN